jgi:hypothetical protein
MNARPDILGQLSRTGYTFFMSDIDLALTLASIAARSGHDDVKRQRNLSNARHAYVRIRELSERVSLSAEEEEQLSKRLAVLRNTLEKLGEHF